MLSVRYLSCLVASLLIGSASVSPAVSQELNPKQLAQLHEASVEACALVDLEAKIYREDNLIETWRWTSDGARRRYRTDVTFRKRGEGKFSDTYRESKTSGMRSLRGMPPNGNVSLTVVDQAGLVGEVRHDMRVNIHDRQQWFALQRFRLSAEDHERSLPELIAAAPSPIQVNQIEESGFIKLTIPHAGVVNEQGQVRFKESDVVVRLDPKRAYAAVEVDYRVREEPNKLLYRMLYQTGDDWYSEAGGYFPKQVTSTYFDDQGKAHPQHGLRMEFDMKSLNEPIAADAFDFQFPKNLLVQEISADSQPANMFLVGENGDFVKTFESVEELHEFVGKHFETGVATRHRNIIIAVNLFLIVVVLLIYLRWKRQRQTRHA